jgi:hypothetical protein
METEKATVKTERIFINFLGENTMTDNKFFIPTKQEILDLEVGSLAPDFTGQLKEVVEITAKEQDINGKWFICYYVEFGKNGKISHSLKEDKLDLSLPLCKEYTSHELDNIEKRILNER